MSKSPNNLLPFLGGAALVVGVGFGISSRDYGSDRIHFLEDRLDRVSADVALSQDAVAASQDQTAALQQEIAALQEATMAKPANGLDLTAPAPASEGRLGLGRAAHAMEISAWDVDVLPDGRGLPDGSGDVWTGEEVFVDRCASCHGDFAEGVDNWPVLAGGFDTLGDEDPVKTVGSYWPYLSTAWDYINRSMPFGEAGTLTADETYAIVAYLLYSNDLVDDDFELNQDNFAEFNMHNMNGFVIDDRPDREYAAWRAEPCMENCKDSVEITMRSVFLVNTPDAGGSESVMNHATIDGLPTFSAAGPSFVPVAEAAPEQKVELAPADPAPEAGDPQEALITAGAKVFKKCKACHEVGAGAKNKSGPQLNALLGRTMGAVDGFKYSKVFKAAQEEGRIWDEDALAAFLRKPKSYMKGTKMSFSGLKKDADVEAITAYLKTLTE